MSTASFSTTVMSSKGQVVIPEEVREDLRLRPGTKFIVLGRGDTVMLKSIKPPSFEGFKGMLGALRAQARRAGMRRSSVAGAIRRVRHRNNP